MLVYNIICCGNDEHKNSFCLAYQKLDTLYSYLQNSEITLDITFFRDNSNLILLLKHKQYEFINGIKNNKLIYIIDPKTENTLFIQKGEITYYYRLNNMRKVYYMTYNFNYENNSNDDLPESWLSSKECINSINYKCHISRNCDKCIYLPILKILLYDDKHDFRSDIPKLKINTPTYEYQYNNINYRGFILKYEDKYVVYYFFISVDINNIQNSVIVVLNKKFVPIYFIKVNDKKNI